MTVDRYTKSTEQLTAQAAYRDTSSRFPRAGTLNHIANIAMAVLHSSREIGVPWTYTSHRLTLHLNRGRAHTLFPVDPIQVFNLHCNRCTKRFAVTHSTDKTNGIFLN